MQILGQSYDMSISFNSNIKLLMGGSYCGGSEWNKPANDIDKCFKLYFLRKGEAELIGEKGNITIKGPGLYFINGYTIKSQKCTSKMIVDWIHFQPESVYFNYILQFAPCGCELNNDAFSSFQPLFKQFNHFFLKRLDVNTERISKLEIQAFIQLAIAHVFKTLDKTIFENDTSIVRLLPALEYINQHYKSEINLKQVAEVCFLSPNYFHRLFSQTFNKTPLNYIRDIRMEEAIRQLTYTSKPVKQIAFDTGYEDQAYFSRSFSKTYGISPGLYRKQNSKRIP